MNVIAAALVLTSDASALAVIDGKVQNIQERFGCGYSLTKGISGTVIKAGFVNWPSEFLGKKGEDGRFICSKSMFIELMGILLGLCDCLELCKRREVNFEVDNLGAVYCLHNRRSSVCDYSSMIVKAINLICFNFCIRANFHHCPRMSTQPAIQADFLSRDDSKRTITAQKIGANPISIPEPIGFWMKKGVSAKDISFNLLSNLN